MTAEALMRMAVGIGMDHDPRGREALTHKLRRVAEAYDGLSAAQRADADLASIWNPFGDTRLVVDVPGQEIEAVLVGIEIGAGEILLADRLRERMKKTVLVVSHHTLGLGKALASAWDTVDVQVDLMVALGVASFRAKAVTRELAEIKEREKRCRDRRLLQLAEGLGLPLATLHAPADLMAHHAIVTRVKDGRARTLKEFIAVSREIPEFHLLAHLDLAPQIALGRPDSPFEPAYYSLIGGWNPLSAGVEALGKAGVRSLVMLECGEEIFDVARKFGMSVILLPHHPFDSLGLNLLFDAVMRQKVEHFDILACSNYLRVER